MACPAPTQLTTHFNAATRPRIILFGDSLTERANEVPGGWAHFLAANYSRRADIVNRGFSGYNSRWAVQLLPYVFGHPRETSTDASAAALPRVLFATVLLGANDAARLEGPSHSARQHVPVKEYAANLKKIVEYARSTGVERIVLMTPPPVWEAGRKAHQLTRMGKTAVDLPLDRTTEHTYGYAKAAARVAATMGVPCLDLFHLLQEERDWGETLMCDGLHFTALGQERLWQLLQELLAREWPEIRPDKLPSQFPNWSDIDADDVASSFAATDD